MSGDRRVFLSDLGVVSALGHGKHQVRMNLFAGSREGMVGRSDILVDGATAYVGQVHADLPEVPDGLSMYESRNLRLVMAAVDEIEGAVSAAKERYGAKRIAVIMGTSTSGIDEGEQAVREALRTGALPNGYDMRQQELGSVGESLARYIGAGGPAYTISTACSSGSLALAAGQRLLLCGIADAVIVGGADSLCRLTVNGFNALSALSTGYCNSMSRNRDGTCIGEGAAIFLMTREESEIALFGTGTSTDAYSMTGPEPEGRGVEEAVNRALASAGMSADDMDYIQLHGTGTQQNDVMESKVVKRMFRPDIPCSSSKGQIGHTLGAAGAMGAAHCWLAAHSDNTERFLPPHLWDGEAEPGLLSDSLVVVGERIQASKPPRFLSNAFAFGGSNAALVLGRAD